MLRSGWTAVLLQLTPCACGGAETPLPDLAIDRDTLATDLAIETRTFTAAACEASEIDRCVSAAGERRLLRFSTATMNTGEADLVLGDPRDRPGEFEFSSCHGHYHLADYASYELVDHRGTAVVEGQKRAFCLRDSIQPGRSADGPAQPKYTCEDQGLQKGWADLYDASVPCQWIDITGVPDGDYELIVRVDPSDLFEESDIANNEEGIPVRVGSPALDSPEEPCDPALDPDALAGLTRECGWMRAATWECAPGSYVTATCGDPSAPADSSCTGSPVLRVCDAASENCTTGASLASAGVEAGQSCPRIDILECPPSGRVAAYSGARQPGDRFSCDVAFGYL